MAFILPVIYISVLLLDRRERCGREKIMYAILAAIAVALGIPAGIGAGLDHVGASLSGMISLFMR